MIIRNHVIANICYRKLQINKTKLPRKKSKNYIKESNKLLASTNKQKKILVETQSKHNFSNKKIEEERSLQYFLPP